MPIRSSHFVVPTDLRSVSGIPLTSDFQEAVRELLTVARCTVAIPEQTTFFPPLQTVAPWDHHSTLCIRSPGGDRSFSWRSEGDRSDWLCTVKGADITNPRSVKRGAWRLSKGQLPGGLTQSPALAQFENAILLHHLALEQHGVLAATALPIQVTQVTHVPFDGGFVSFDDFIESTPYRNLCAEHARAIPSGALKGRFAATPDRPCQYLYLQEGSALRVEEAMMVLATALVGVGLSSSDPWRDHPCAEVLPVSPHVPVPPHVLVGLMSHVASQLGCEIAIPLNAAIGEFAISEWFADIRAQLTRGGYADEMVNRFAGRVGRLLGLMHRNRICATECGEGNAGSFHWRNTTVSGCVLDLDTIVRAESPLMIERFHAGARSDIEQALGTVLCVASLVHESPRMAAWQALMERYSEALSHDPHLRRILLTHLGTLQNIRFTTGPKQEPPASRLEA